MKITMNRLALRSRIEELEMMIGNIMARVDITADTKKIATDGLHSTIAELETDFNKGWVGAW